MFIVCVLRENNASTLCTGCVVKAIEAPSLCCPIDRFIACLIQYFRVIFQWNLRPLSAERARTTHAVISEAHSTVPVTGEGGGGGCW